MIEKINYVLHGFLLGMLIEYLIRVQVSIFPILITVLILFSVIIDLISNYYLKQEKELIAKVNAHAEKLKTIPEGWIVYDAGQNITNKLWFIELLYCGDEDKSNDGPPRVYVEDGQSYEEVLITAIKLAD